MSPGYKCFPGKHRLANPSEYRKVFAENTRSVDSRFVVLARENDLGYSRLGLAVSKKKINTAVKRNLVKRVVRESFRQAGLMSSGHDMVVMPQKTIDLSDREMLRKSLDRHWRKVSRCNTF